MTPKTQISSDDQHCTTAVTPLANPSMMAIPVESHLRDKALRLITVLQTTLELESLVASFSHELGQIIHHASMSYHLSNRGIRIDVGKPAVHSCVYRMLVEQEFLGEVRFTRDIPFSEQELAHIEFLLSCLTYPLRNGLRYQMVSQAALRDPLTGVSNRAVLDQSLGREIGLARRNGMPLALLMIDIDNFKSINDTFGHAAGDLVLREIATALSTAVRESDLVCRYGGEEFSVLLNNSSRDGAAMLAERLRITVQDLICTDETGHEIRVTASIGMAALTVDDDAGSLLKRADKALYQAKGKGRDCCHIAN